MSDAHLFLGDDGVAFAGSVNAVWYDESHGSVLMLTAPSRQLVEIPLGSYVPPAPHDPVSSHGPPLLARSKSAPGLAFDATYESPSPCEEELENGHRMLYDFGVAPSSAAGREVDSAAPIVLMRLSLDRQFLAIQKSDVEVQIVRLATRENYWIVCKSKPGNRILSDGVVWNTHAASPQSSQDLFLVTRLGIEQYRVSSKRRSCTLHRTIAVYVHRFWYSASHSVLIVSTGSRANEIVPFLMQGPTVEKLPRLVFSSTVRTRDLYLASLYDDLYAIYGDSKTTRLLLYRITRDKVSCVRSLHLMLPAGSPLKFSVVDNLLVCHSVEFSVALFFDIKCDANTHDPFSHPLPVSLIPPASASRHRNQSLHKAASFAVDSRRNSAGDEFQALRPSLCLPEQSAQSPSRATHQTPVHMNHNEQSSRDSSGDKAGSPWRFLPPDFVQRNVMTGEPRSMFADRIEIRRFHLNLEHVSRTCAQHAEILPFLLRRGDQVLAKRLALGLVREKIEEQTLAPAAVAALLSSVQTVTAQALEQYGTHRINTGGGSGVSVESGNDTSSDDEVRVNYAAQAVVPLSLRKHLLREGRSGDPLSAAFARVPSRNANGLSMVFQSEFRQYLWQPLLDNTSMSSIAPLSSYLMHFIRILHQSHLPVEAQTYTALAKSFLLAGMPEQLYQVVQYHIFSDSTELADLLLAYSKTQDISLRQLSLDMYTRLGATATVIQILLDDGQVDEAISVAWEYLKRGTGDLRLISSAAFFEACIRSCGSTDGQTTSTMVVQQRLHSLLIFLRMWDSECLLGEPSALALSVSIQFPDDLVPESTRQKWRKFFGFSST